MEEEELSTGSRSQKEGYDWKNMNGPGRASKPGEVYHLDLVEMNAVRKRANGKYKSNFEDLWSL